MSFSLTLVLSIVCQGPAAKAEWRVFTPPGKEYTISMPGEPKHKTRDVRDSPMKVEEYAVDLGDVTYTVGYSQLPMAVLPQTAGVFIEGICKAVAAANKGTITQLKPIKAEGMEGREVYCDFIRPEDKRPSATRARGFIVGSRAFLITYEGPKGTADREEVQKFLDSFKLTDGSANAATPEMAKGSKLPLGRSIGTAVAAKWRPITPVEKGFTVSMPGDPKQESPEPKEGYTKIDNFEVDLGDRLFLATVYETPKSVPAAEQAKALEAMCTSLAAEAKGTIAENKPIKFDGLTGREVFIEFAAPDNGKADVGRARVFMVGARAYLVFYRGEKGTADRAEVQKFLSSLRIVKSTAPAKGKTRP